MPSKLDTFFAGHPVFTVQDLDAFLSREGTGNPETRKALLVHHQRQGHILGIRRGVYASVPAGADPKTHPVDPFLLVSRLGDEAVLAYHTALAFHGRAYSHRTEYVAVSTQPHVEPLRFQGNSYRIVRPPLALVRSGVADFGVEVAERQGLPVRVTSLGRTLVDCLDRPELAGGWEEIWRSFDDVAFLDVHQVVTYALLLDNAVVAAKVGYFLDQNRDALGVTDDQLDRLKQRRPRQPRYGAGDRAGSRFDAAWNIMAPGELVGLSRQEIV